MKLTQAPSQSVVAPIVPRIARRRRTLAERRARVQAQFNAEMERLTAWREDEFRCAVVATNHTSNGSAAQLCAVSAAACAARQAGWPDYNWFRASETEAARALAWSKPEAPGKGLGL